MLKEGQKVGAPLEVLQATPPHYHKMSIGNRKYQLKRVTKQPSMQNTKMCHCGKGSHLFQACPARDTIYFRCHRKGHFGSKCLSKTIAEVKNSMDNLDIYREDYSYLDAAYLDTIKGDSDLWTELIQMDNKPVTFKIDTGSENTCKSLTTTPALNKPKQSLITDIFLGKHR